MDNNSFIHLRVHSAYSLAEGAITAKDVIKLAKANDMPAIAITDTHNMFGAMEFSLSAPGEGIQPILGTSIALKISTGPMTDDVYKDLVLLVKDEKGYLNLSELMSRSYTIYGQDGDPHIDFADLQELNEGIICLTGGYNGPLGYLLSAKHENRAEELLDNLQASFGDRLYIELSRHGLQQEEFCEKYFLDWAYAKNIPLVATNNVFFKNKEMHQAHDALLCISGGNYVIEDNRRKETVEHYFKTPAEMRELFKDIPEACNNTIQIAKRCSHFLEVKDPLLPHADCGEGRTENEELRFQAEKGLRERMDIFVYTDDMTPEEKEAKRKEYFDRLDFELSIIIQMGFPGYFLICMDFIKWAKSNDIPVGPGRGSGAGSIVAWSLYITNLDPIPLDLLFERFLNPERVSMPDFDIDFCQSRRGEVIQYVQNKYGKDSVAQIITFGKLKAKAVVRDVGRVLQMSYFEVDKVAKLIPMDAKTIQDALDTEVELDVLRRTDEKVERLIEVAQKLEGLYRHASTHAAGVLIGDRPLPQLVPLYVDPKSDLDMPSSQFNMKTIEQTGLIKFDFLGLKTLTVIKRALKIIKATYDVDLDIDTIPIDDKKTFELLQRADTIGVFQLESSGMQDVIARLKPTNFDDIIALVSLYRPGPMDNIPTYIAVKHGKQKANYYHPIIQKILEPTYGIPVYQEQVQQIAQTMAGYSLGEGDMLRRAMGKKIKEAMDVERPKFIAGSEKNGVSRKKAEEVFDVLEKFASYGFNKSHAAAYALIAYQTAYLKAHYPVAFMTALMHLDVDNPEKLAIFRQDARDMGIDVLPPHVNKSRSNFAVEKNTSTDSVSEGSQDVIRYALGAIKGVGVGAMKSLVEERLENGEFKGVFDLVERVGDKGINKKQLEGLTYAGALDSIHPNRAQIIESMDILSKYASTYCSEKNSNQVSLFGGEDMKLETPKLAIVKPWNNGEKLEYEFKAVGMYLSAHPLDIYNKTLKAMDVIEFKDVIKEVRNTGKDYVRLAGMITAIQQRVSKRGNKFAFVGLSDASGSYEVTLFSEVLENCKDVLEVGKSVVVSATADVQEDSVKLLAAALKDLESEMAKATKSIKVHIVDEKAVAPMQEILKEAGAGKVKVDVIMTVYDAVTDASGDDDEATAFTQAKKVEMSIGKFNLIPNTIDEIRVIEGIGKVEDFS